MVPFCPVPFCTTVPFCPNIPCSILPPSLRLEKSHYVNYNIARCSIKWCENANNKYIIISNHMQRFYYLICFTASFNASGILHVTESPFDSLWFVRNRQKEMFLSRLLININICIRKYNFSTQWSEWHFITWAKEWNIWHKSWAPAGASFTNMV